VGVDHSGAHIAVAEEFLNRTDVIAILKEVGSKRLSQGVIILLTNSLSRRFITDITRFMERKSK